MGSSSHLTGVLIRKGNWHPKVHQDVCAQRKDHENRARRRPSTGQGERPPRETQTVDTNCGSLGLRLPASGTVEKVNMFLKPPVCGTGYSRLSELCILLYVSRDHGCEDVAHQLRVTCVHNTPGPVFPGEVEPH